MSKLWLGEHKSECEPEGEKMAKDVGKKLDKFKNESVLREQSD